MAKNLLVIGNLNNEPKGETKLRRFLPVLVAAADSVVLVSANCPPEYREKVVWIQTEHVIRKRKNYLTRTINFILSQLKLIFRLATVPDRVKYGMVMFLRPYPAAMLFARLMGKRVVRYQGGVASREPGTAGWLSRFFVEEPAAFFSHRIIIQSPSCLEFQNLTRYRRKVVVGYFPIDSQFFKPQKDVKNREDIIGYIADLTENKGVRNFFQAILMLKDKNFKFIIGGEGPLKGEIRKKIAENNLTGRITLAGWIPHEEMPIYLNKLKLLLLPSSSEGVPTILLEAMSCGTPVLATPVGGIPDILKDGENGFLLPDSSPASIARGIVRALNYPLLSEVGQSARKFLEKEYRREAAIARFKKIFSELESGEVA